MLNAENTNVIAGPVDNLETENNYILLTIKITNNSDEAYSVNAGNFNLESDGCEYEYDANALFYLDDPLYMDTINPKLSKEYSIIYETQTLTDEADYTLVVHQNMFTERESELVRIELKSIPN